MTEAHSQDMVHRCCWPDLARRESRVFTGFLRAYDNSILQAEKITDMKKHFAIGPRVLFGALIALMTTARPALGDTNEQQAASDSDYTVKLRYGKEIVLAEAATQTLYSNAVQLLETSNFNSTKHYTGSGPNYEVSRTQEAYRQTVSGKYLLVSFKKPRPVETVGGQVSVKEIVVGFNRSDYAYLLFTIDEEGRVITHEKYSGAMCVKLLQIVKGLVNGP
jgi:hypothetical protein